MINIDFLTIKAFLAENIDFIIGSRIQKIQQPTRRDLILFLRNNSESRKLYININPSIYHLAFITPETELARNIKIPKQPPMFCMLLRKYLEGVKISDTCAIENERILELHFEKVDEFGEEKSLCLATELMGKHSNVILYDRKTSLIIGCAHNVGAEKSRYRELKGGLRYILPPHNNTVLSNELKEQFKNLPEDKIKYYLSTEKYTPAISNNRYTLFSELLENAKKCNSVNQMLDDYYAKYQHELTLLNEKNKITNLVYSKLKKNKNAFSKINNALSINNSKEKYKLFGELLTANLYLKADYLKSIVLCDYNSNCEVEIELDNTKTMNENAQRYFKLYSKYKTANEKSAEILNNLVIEKDYLENLLYSVELAETFDDLEEIENELGISEIKEKQKNKSEILKTVINGFEVFIGKNNKQNDYIISKLAKDEDYWFHTRLCAGSHVLLKTNDIEPDDITIEECAKLARKYSSAKQPSKVGVIYTKRKYLKKPPAAPLGYVTYKNEKEILI